MRKGSGAKAPALNQTQRHSAPAVSPGDGCIILHHWPSALAAQPCARACISEGTRRPPTNPADREEPTEGAEHQWQSKGPLATGRAGGGPRWQALCAASQPALNPPPASTKAALAQAEVDSGDGETLQSHFLLKCLQPVGCVLSAMGNSGQLSFAASAF